jgi:glycosyltransferase involved in cell wall biosynthesis
LGNSNHHQYVFNVLEKIRTAGLSHAAMLYLHDPCLLHLIYDAVGRAPAEFIGMMERLYHKTIPLDAISFNKFSMSEILVEEGILGVRFFFNKFGIHRYLVNSSTAAELCRRDLDGLPASVERVFHPVALPGSWRPPAAERSPDGPAKPLVVGTFGRPGPDKRTDVVVTAVRELRRRGVAVQLVVAGFESAYWALSRADELRGLDVHTQDAPSDHQFLDAMSGVDIAVQLREKNMGESSGVVHELLALGRSVIVSDVGSFREFGEAVRTVPADASPGVLADAIFHTWKSPVPPAAIAEYVAAHSARCFRQALVKVCKDDATERKTILDGLGTATVQGPVGERVEDKEGMSDPADSTHDPRPKLIAKVA